MIDLVKIDKNLNITKYQLVFCTLLISTLIGLNFYCGSKVFGNKYKKYRGFIAVPLIELTQMVLITIIVYK